MELGAILITRIQHKGLPRRMCAGVADTKRVLMNDTKIKPLQQSSFAQRHFGVKGGTGLELVVHFAPLLRVYSFLTVR